VRTMFRHLSWRPWWHLRRSKLTVLKTSLINPPWKVEREVITLFRRSKSLAKQNPKERRKGKVAIIFVGWARLLVLLSPVKYANDV
jgi:hypothetical protein